MVCRSGSCLRTAGSHCGHAGLATVPHQTKAPSFGCSRCATRNGNSRRSGRNVWRSNDHRRTERGREPRRRALQHGPAIPARAPPRFHWPSCPRHRIDEARPGNVTWIASSKTNSKTCSAVASISRPSTVRSLRWMLPFARRSGGKSSLGGNANAQESPCREGTLASSRSADGIHARFDGMAISGSCIARPLRRNVSAVQGAQLEQRQDTL